MAYRYLIYSTGTTFSGTILKDNGAVIPTPSANTASFYTNFIIPEIQPLYLWQVDNVVIPTTLIPNTDVKISNYEITVAPSPQPNDSISYGQVTGMTNTKLDKFVGTTLNIPLIAQSGNALSDSGYNIEDIITAGSGITNATFAYYTGTTAPNQFANKAAVNYYTGTTAPNTYYNKSQINNYTGATSVLISTKVTRLTGATQNDIVTFGVGGQVSDSGKQFTTTVQSVGLAVNTLVPTELAVRNAINQAVVAAIILQGDWNASTNVPDLTVTGITTGFAWRVSATGTTSLGGLNYWLIGDMAVKSAGGWIRVASQDIAAIWGNISGSIANQTDLQNALNLKLNTSIYQTYTGTTAPNTFANKALVNFYTGTTAPNTYKTIALVNYYTGTTVPNTYQTIANVSYFTGTTLPANYYNKTQINYFSGTTLPANYYNKTQINYFTGTTLVSNYYNKSQINSYTGATNTKINTKLDTSIFTGYTASTKNVDKKIQVISTSVANANVVIPLEITWNSASPYANDMYTWSGGTPVWIKSAGTYEVQYHVLLKNDNANQTHSVGGYVLLNGSTVISTASAGMVVGQNASGELSLPPVILTLAVNDRLDLAIFRIGAAGNANLVSGSVFMTLNKLT